VNILLFPEEDEIDHMVPPTYLMIGKWF